MIILLEDFLQKKCLKQKSFIPTEKYEGKFLLFLDIDGVMHSLVDIKNSFNKSYILNKLLDEFPNVMIVVSSSWAVEHSLNSLRSMFPSMIKDRIIDSISAQPSRNRGKNIKNWIKENSNYSDYPWFAIDDAAIFDNNDPVYWTNSREGLTDNDLKYLRNIFTNPIEYNNFKIKDDL